VANFKDNTRRRLKTQSQVKVIGTKKVHLHGQTIEVQIVEPAQCAGFSSWRDRVPHSKGNTAQLQRELREKSRG
jgi:hypothetical protein